MASPAPPGGAALRLDRGDLVCRRRGADPDRVSRVAFWELCASYLAVVRAEPRIGPFGLILARTSPEMMALFVAMIAAGRTVSFFPPNGERQDLETYVEQQHEAVMNIAPSSILVLDEALQATLRRLDPALGSLLVRLPRPDRSRGPGEAAGAACRDAFVAALAAPDRLLFWQHSSGTTGIKKAVGVTAGMLLAQFEAYWPLVREHAGGEDVRIASWLPLYHDMGLLTAFLLPLLGGAEVAMMDPFEWADAPHRFLAMIEAERSNVCWMPNFAFRHYTRLARVMKPHDLGSVRSWISCSEPCRYLDVLGFEEAFSGWGVTEGSVNGCYAMAETVFAVSQLTPGAQKALIAPRTLRPGESLAAAGAAVTRTRRPQLRPDQQAVLSSGRAVGSLVAAVYVDDLPVAEGVFGEVGVRGEFLFSGYRSLSRATSRLSDDGLYLTGDLGVILDGELYILGRSKEVIIVNGKNIYAADVEDHVGRAPGVRSGRVAAFGIESALSGSEQLVIVAETDDSPGLEEADIRAAVVSLVHDAFLVKPHDVRLLDHRWLVKSSSGKVSRDRNRSKYLRDFSGDAT